MWQFETGVKELLVWRLWNFQVTLPSRPFSVLSTIICFIWKCHDHSCRQVFGHKVESRLASICQCYSTWLTASSERSGSGKIQAQSFSPDNITGSASCVGMKYGGVSGKNSSSSSCAWYNGAHILEETALPYVRTRDPTQLHMSRTNTVHWLIATTESRSMMFLLTTIVTSRLSFVARHDLLFVSTSSLEGHPTVVHIPLLITVSKWLRYSLYCHNRVPLQIRKLPKVQLLALSLPSYPTVLRYIKKGSQGVCLECLVGVDFKSAVNVPKV